MQHHWIFWAFLSFFSAALLIILSNHLLKYVHDSVVLISRGIGIVLYTVPLYLYYLLTDGTQQYSFGQHEIPKLLLLGLIS